MNSAATHKSTRMVAAEERKLSASIPALMHKLGFSLVDGSCRDEWRQVIDDTAIHATAIIDNGRPWLACQFSRPYPRPDLRWNATENRSPYRDMHESLGANPHNGKCNCIISRRVTAENALSTFRQHLALMLDAVECGAVAA